jgi:transposase
MTPEPPIPKQQWDRIPPIVQTALCEAFHRYEQQIARPELRVRELEERLGRNSTNSSRPPSSDAPVVKRAPPRPATGRRGGQPGHQFHRRALLPPDHVHALKPAACRGWGHVLSSDDPQPRRHQVLELPTVRPTVTEYQLHRLRCPHSRHTTCAAWPAGVPRGGHGPRLQSVVALLTGAYRLSKRMARTLCADLSGVPVCTGQICALEARTTVALEPVVALREHVRRQPANVDETGWRHQGRRGWLWVAVTALATVFEVAPSRGGAVGRGLVEVPAGQVITTDRSCGYNWLPLRQRQLCRAHLRRDFQAMIDQGGPGRVMGERLLCCAEDLFHWWHRVRDAMLRRSTFRQYLSVVRAMTRDELEAGRSCGPAKTAATCAELLKLEPALWPFARVEGIEPTNNAAEQALRHAVQWRRASYGTDSEGAVASRGTSSAWWRPAGSRAVTRWSSSPPAAKPHSTATLLPTSSRPQTPDGILVRPKNGYISLMVYLGLLASSAN